MIYTITRNGGPTLGTIDIDVTKPLQEIAEAASAKCEEFMTQDELDQVECASVQQLSWPGGFMLAIKFPPICLFGVHAPQPEPPSEPLKFRGSTTTTHKVADLTESDLHNLKRVMGDMGPFEDETDETWKSPSRYRKD